MKLTIKAYAKLNLSLDIKEKLPNGYHIIETVFQSISLHFFTRMFSAFFTRSFEGGSTFPSE